MHPSLSQLEHRPWPLPARRWTWRQSWHDLLFAHWPIDVTVARRLVPEELEVDLFEGRTFVGVVPFRMEGVMRRPWPDLPWISAFPELNLRLYVRHGDRPGVWFLSLDAANPLAVWAARRFFHLPYFHARMALAPTERAIRYTSIRRRDPRGLTFECEYSPTGEVRRAEPGTLDHWLTERYCLYARSAKGALYRGEIHHAPWPLQPAEASFSRNELGEPHELSIEGEPELLHFSRRIDVVVWSLERVAQCAPARPTFQDLDAAVPDVGWGKLRHAYESTTRDQRARRSPG